MAFLFLMVVAGNETTTKLLANAAYLGPRRTRTSWRPVFADHSRVPLWVEETLRYDTSSQILARTVAERHRRSTAPPFHDGDVLLLLPGSAHRDERVFENPDDLPASGATSGPSC